MSDQEQDQDQQQDAQEEREREPLPEDVESDAITSTDDARAAAELAEAERAVALHGASPEQIDGVARAGQVRSVSDRLDAWRGRTRDPVPDAAPDSAPDPAPDAATDAAPDLAPDAAPDAGRHAAPTAPGRPRITAAPSPDPVPTAPHPGDTGPSNTLVAAVLVGVAILFAVWQARKVRSRLR